MDKLGGSLKIYTMYWFFSPGLRQIIKYMTRIEKVEAAPATETRRTRISKNTDSTLS